MFLFYVRVYKIKKNYFLKNRPIIASEAGVMLWARENWGTRDSICIISQVGFFKLKNRKKIKYKGSFLWITKKLLFYPKKSWFRFSFYIFGKKNKKFKTSCWCFVRWKNSKLGGMMQADWFFFLLENIFKNFYFQFGLD